MEQELPKSNHLNEGLSFTAIGAISINKVLANANAMNDSRDGRAFAVFIEKFFGPEFGKGAVVVMDNLPAHKLASIVPMIEAGGASVLSRYPYSPDFNPMEAMVVTA